jgi:hypothetical protein
VGADSGAVQASLGRNPTWRPPVLVLILVLGYNGTPLESLEGGDRRRTLALPRHGTTRTWSIFSIAFQYI